MSNLRLAIDMGSSKTAFYQVGQNVILCEPTLVAISADGDTATGFDAKKMVGKSAKSISVVSPVVDGEIVKETPAVTMLKSFFAKIELSYFNGKEALVAIPVGTENAALSTFRRVLSQSGIDDVYFIESPIAAAVGLNAPVSSSETCFVVDIGGNVTNIAAVSLTGVIAGVSFNMGGANLARSLIGFLRDKYGLLIGIPTVEALIREIGSLLPGDTSGMVISGSDVEQQTPRSMRITAEMIQDPIRAYFNDLHSMAHKVIAKLPPEVAAEIRRRGVYLAGGGSGIVGIEEYFHDEFSMNVCVGPDPELAVAIGAGKIMQNEKVYKRLRFA